MRGFKAEDQANAKLLARDPDQKVQSEVEANVTRLRLNLKPKFCPRGLPLGREANVEAKVLSPRPSSKLRS